MSPKPLPSSSERPSPKAGMPGSGSGLVSKAVGVARMSPKAGKKSGLHRFAGTPSLWASLALSVLHCPRLLRLGAQGGSHRAQACAVCHMGLQILLLGVECRHAMLCYATCVLRVCYVCAAAAGPNGSHSWARRVGKR
jgi:hypothetical protein